MGRLEPKGRWQDPVLASLDFDPECEHGSHADGTAASFIATFDCACGRGVAIVCSAHAQELREWSTTRGVDHKQCKARAHLHAIVSL